MRLLDEVSLETHPLSLYNDQVRGLRPLPEARSYYRPALELAIAILTGRGIDLDTAGTSVSLPSLLVRTDSVFEQFVRLNLQEAYIGDSDLSVLDGNTDDGCLPLYEDLGRHDLDALPPGTVVIGGSSNSDPDVEPDVVFQRSDGSYPLIADVKYTNVRRHADRAEVEQIALYGMRYRSATVMTVHPKRNDTRGGMHVSGRIGDTIVYQYRVDLAADDLGTGMRTMTDCTRALIAGVGAPSSSA